MVRQNWVPKFKVFRFSNLPCQPTEAVGNSVGLPSDVVEAEVEGHQFANHPLYSRVFNIPHYGPVLPDKSKPKDGDICDASLAISISTPSPDASSSCLE